MWIDDDEFLEALKRELDGAKECITRELLSACPWCWDPPAGDPKCLLEIE